MEFLKQGYTTPRLVIQPLQDEHHFFIRELVNTDGWLRFIGDRKIDSIDAALAYIRKINDGPNIHYYVVQLSEKPIGIVTFLKRDYLDHYDLGFAFLPDYCGKGYAFEAASHLLTIVRQVHVEVLAVTLPTNTTCIKLLNRLGFKFREEIIKDKNVLAIYSLKTAGRGD